MNYERKIERLELAVLHLTRAVNDLVDALESTRNEANASAIRVAGTTLHSDPESAIRAAKEHLKEALDMIAEPV